MKPSTKRYLLISAAILAVLAVLLYQNNTSAPETAPASPPTHASSPDSPAQPASVNTSPQPQPASIRLPVLRLSGQLGDGSPDSRRAALAALPRDLHPGELSTIYAAILEHPQPTDFPRRAWHAFFNDTLNALVLDQQQPVAELPERLLAIVQDVDRHRVIRDYALQHLLAFAEHRAEASERVELMETAWEGIDKTRDSYRGTYLVALSYQAGEPGWPAVESVSTKAWKVAASGDAHVLSRITALQVCGKLGYQEALPLALQIAADVQAHMTLRTSAIATIGDLGLVEDQVFLNELAERSPPRLQVAIQAALARIDRKKGQA